MKEEWWSSDRNVWWYLLKIVAKCHYVKQSPHGMP
jgi:hypothetical protein